MAKNLVIVESPTKAKTIGKMLGKNYKVLASIGHLRDLPKSKLGVDLENDFEPEYITVRGKGTKVKEIKDEYKKADKIFLATDPDREGEAISWHIATLLNLDGKSLNRVEFHEITKEAVVKAIKEPRTLDMALIDSQQARRVMDRIVGYKLSPILWKKIRSGLSAGRVQSVALKLICDRETEIKNFIPEEYWTIKALHKEENIEFFSEFYGEFNRDKEVKIKLSNKEECKAILDKISKDNFKISDIKKNKKSKNPYAPYTTSTLQQDASNKLGFTTARTMRIAQQLFEGVNVGSEGSVGLITYMRTDSTRLSEICINDCLNFIVRNFGEAYKTSGKTYGAKKKGTQGAHEAIRPSKIDRTPAMIKDDLTDEQYKLYKLIWERTVASQMAAMKYESTSVTFDNNGFIFKSTGNKIIFNGYVELLGKEDDYTILPKLEKNQIISGKKLTDTQHFTKPPARYSEASLVKALEEDGIGRPSTYASIIKSITDRGYANIEKRRFIPTNLGENVNSLLLSYFENVINEEFTAKMENELDEIADKKIKWKETVKNFYLPFNKSLELALKDETDYKEKDEILDELCPDCKKNLVIKNGRNGKFIGCMGFPDCKYTKSIVKDLGIKCPKCKKGMIVEKISKRRKVFYGCSNYPDCDFAIWDKPTGEVCEKCGSILVHIKNRNKNVIKCINEKCDFEKIIKNNFDK